MGVLHFFALKDGFSIPLRETFVGVRHEDSASYLKLDSAVLNTALLSMSNIEYLVISSNTRVLSYSLACFHPPSKALSVSK